MASTLKYLLLALALTLEYSVLLVTASTLILGITFDGLTLALTSKLIVTANETVEKPPVIE
jgi:hypothetical protein